MLVRKGRLLIIVKNQKCNTFAPFWDKNKVLSQNFMYLSQKMSQPKRSPIKGLRAIGSVWKKSCPKKCPSQNPCYHYVLSIFIYNNYIYLYIRVPYIKNILSKRRESERNSLSDPYPYVQKSCPKMSKMASNRLVMPVSAGTNLGQLFSHKLTKWLKAFIYARFGWDIFGTSLGQLCPAAV